MEACLTLGYQNTKLMYYLCEYIFVTLWQPRNFWDRITGHVYTNRSLILIKAESKEIAEEKFHIYFEERHPGRKLRAFSIGDTIV